MSIVDRFDCAAHGHVFCEEDTDSPSEELCGVCGALSWAQFSVPVVERGGEDWSYWRACDEVKGFECEYC